MSLDRFSQFSETNPLKKVIIGRWQGYAEDESYIEVVNEEQKKGLPSIKDLEREFAAFEEALRAHGVEVLIPERVGRFVYDQLTPRDIGVTIGHRFVICNMAKSSRRYEVAGIFPFLNEMTGPKPEILIPDGADTLLEGGDILVDKNRIFVGLSQRSNQKGVDFLKKHFGDRFEVVPVHCRSLAEGENVLHLDCTLNFVGDGLALIYPEGFLEVPEILKSGYRWLEVTAREQALLGTNVLSLDKKTVVARQHPELKRLNQMLRDQDLEVIEVKFDSAPATGGSFRCCTLPLVRGK